MKRRQFLHTATTTLAATTLGHQLSAIATKPHSRKLALLIGINDYSKTQGLEVPSLSGCTNDVLLLKKLLQYRYGFPPENIITLTNAQATRANILRTFENHLLTAGPDDIAVCSLSGHGTILQGNTTGFVPYDLIVKSNGDTNCITGTTFLLLRSLLKTNQVTTLFDCCYAGNIKRSFSGKARQVRQPLTSPDLRPNDTEKKYQAELKKSLNLDDRTLQNNRTTQKGTKGILLAAAAPEQTALDSRLTPTHTAGAYTKALTETLWANPTTSFANLNTRITQNLTPIPQQPEIAQSPDTIPPPSQQPSFFSPPIAPEPAQGIVESINPNTKQITLWLGGCSSHSLTMAVGSCFRLLDGKGTIATLTSPIQPNFTATATLSPNSPHPKPGTLVQQSSRAIPKELQLDLGLDDSLGSFQFPNLPRIKGITLSKKNIVLKNIDIVFSQMTANLYGDPNAPESDRPPIGTYGLFFNDWEYKPNTFGNKDEQPQDALRRLKPQLNQILLKKLFKKLTGSLEEQSSIIPGLSAYIHLAQAQEKIISTPNHIKQAVTYGTEIQISVDNSTNENLQLLIIGIPPQGDIKALPIIMLDKQGVHQVIQPYRIEEQGVGSGIGEFLLFFSTDLSEVSTAIQNLIEELNIQPTKKSQYRSLAPKNFAISLPLQIKPK